LGQQIDGSSTTLWFYDSCVGCGDLVPQRPTSCLKIGTHRCASSILNIAAAIKKAVNTEDFSASMAAKN
jgi:hypothetical protein